VGKDRKKTQEEPQSETVSEEELDKAEGEPLPDREAMTILPVGVDPVPGSKFLPEPPGIKD
jgi:hypothetical protein